MEATTIRSADGFARDLAKNFEDLKDRRVVGRCNHLLLDILTIAILAMFSVADDWPEVEGFGERRKSWLRKWLRLANGIPLHDTFLHEFDSIDRMEFPTCLFLWTQALQKASKGKVSPSMTRGYVSQAIGNAESTTFIC